MNWRNTANEVRRALRSTVVARLAWDQTGDDRADADRLIAEATTLMEAANRLYAELAGDVWTARTAERELARPEQVIATWTSHDPTEETP